MKSYERILFVSDARLIYRGTTFVNSSNHEVKPGINLKKIVVTTHKMYVFRTLANEVDDVQFRIENRGKKEMEQTEDKPKEFISVTGEPENEIEIQEKYGKVVMDEEPSLQEYIKKLNIFTTNRPVKNSVLLLNPIKRSLEMIFFDKLKDAFRFSKAVSCANAWMRYAEECKNKRVNPNLKWAAILQEIVYNQDNLVIIDPLEFDDPNEEEQINCFSALLDKSVFINRLQLKFKINEDFGIQCANKFMGISCMNSIRGLLLPECQITDPVLVQISQGLMKLTSITQLNLSKNNLTDRSLNLFTRILSQNTELHSFNLSHNSFQFTQPESQNNFIDFLRSASQLLSIDLSYNKLSDNSVEIIEKSVIFSQNPPLKEIDLCHNAYTKYGSWRLFKGNLVMKKNHDYMQFILYPIPFNVDIFNEGIQDFPVKRKPFFKPMTNLPVSLSQQLIQQSHSHSTLALSEQNTVGLIIRRRIQSGKPLPKNQEDISSMTAVKSKMSKLITNPNTKLEDILKQAEEISKQKYGYPSSVLEEITHYIWEKLNQALLIRDHESIGILKTAATKLNVDLNPYKERLDKVNKRKDIYSSKLRQIYNLQFGESQINNELDEMVREGLRLSLKGKALNILFYLKDLRDKKIQELISKGYNPALEIQDLKTRNYATFFQVSSGTNVDWDVPYELQEQKDINENLYLHSLQTDYEVLLKIKQDEYHRMQMILQSVKMVNERFLKFLVQAENRIKFITNEFHETFSFNNFKISFVELKINACRLLWHYRNIRKTIGFYSLPNYSRKIPVSPEKYIIIGNKQEFFQRYNVENYPNIRDDCWNQGLYGYRYQMTKYTGSQFEGECKQLCTQTELFLKQVSFSSSRITQDILPFIFKIIKIVRVAMFPEELLQQFYLHVITYQQTNNKITEFLCHLVPFLTMYLKPPRTVEKTLLAFLIKNEFSFSYIPLSIEHNQPEDRVFIERDWLPREKLAMQLINRYGKLSVKIHLTNKQSFILEISEVENVGDLMFQAYLHESLSAVYDKYSYWLYRVGKDREVALSAEDLVGQLLNDWKEDEETLVLKRRVYSPYYTINYRDYTDETVSSLYYEIKYYYLLGFAYQVIDQEIQIASIFAFVSIFDPPVKKTTFNDTQTEFKIYVENLDRFIDQLFPKYYLKEHPTKELIKPLKLRLNERLARQEEIAITNLKKKLIDKFRDKPYYCATNYLLRSSAHNHSLILVSINSMYICMQKDIQANYIFLQSIVNIIPKEMSIVVSYYDKKLGELTQVVFATDQKQSINISMDILSYCAIRLKTPNMFLYLQRQMYAQMIEYSIPFSVFDYETSMNTSLVVKKIANLREDLPLSLVETIVLQFQRILKKLEKLEIVIVTEREFAFHKENLYVKSTTNRLQYPYRVGRKLELSQPLGPRTRNPDAARKSQTQNTKPVPNPIIIQDQQPIMRTPGPKEPVQPQTTALTVPPEVPAEQPKLDDGEIIINRGSRGARSNKDRQSRDHRRSRN